VLAAVGIYGLIAYVAAQRTHEFGIRMALGAAPGAVFRSVIGHGTILTVTGLSIGLVLSLALRRVISTLLFGVTATDPATYVTAAAVFAGLALVATLVPAWRASRLDPTTALRAE
jgi:putative ABC transport system permease protein